ncbi:MAG: hypothetical protein R3F49_10960 [Planctomycetota bacterium]
MGIDGVGSGETTCIVATGLPTVGTKHMLGVLDGASERAKVVLGRVLAWLRTISSSAAENLEEALDTARHSSWRVQRWRDSAMALC